MMNEQETITTATPVVLTPIDYAKPLDPALIATLTQELDAFLAQPANGWDAHYPTLFATLQAIITEYSTAMNCPVPALVLDFTGVDACQARAEAMSDGSARIHIGTSFIRSMLLNTQSADALHLHRSFRWTIAHEIGHLADPKLRRLAKMFNVRLFLNTMGNMQLIVSAATFALSYIAGVTQGPYMLYLYSGVGVKLLHRSFEVFWHHKMEYTADAASLKTADHFTDKEALYALSAMYSTIATITKQQEQAAREALVAASTGSFLLRALLPIQQVILACKQQWKHFNLHLLHPALESRMAAIKKQLAKA